MKALFLSDVHLKGPRDAAHERIIAFFDRIRGRVDTAGGPMPADALSVDHLIVAGDFFDFWFARGDTIYPDFRQVVEKLVALTRSGTRISLCEGNHDFFLADYFSRKLGMDVYPDWTEFDLDGRRVLVSHGDTVDRGNRKYLALRGFLRSAFAFRLQRLLPLTLLWGVARLSSGMSKGMSRESEDRLAEIMHRFARGKFEEGYDAVILGHCHKPLLRQELCDGKQKTFATLGAWMAHDSYLSYDDGRFSLNRFSAI